MKRKAALGLVLACLVTAGGSLAAEQDFSEVPPPSAQMRLAPDLAEVVSMARAKMPTDQVIANIKAWPRMFNLKAADETQLRKFGVKPDVIEAMHAHDKAMMKQWIGGSDGTAPGPDTDAPKRRVVTPKLASTPYQESRMREDRPITFIRAPKASTNDAPTTYKRPWTSSLIVDQQPPPPKLELAPDKPGEDYVWVTGHWELDAGKWVWKSGSWLRRPGPGAAWMDGYWQPHARGWTWVPGRWK